MATLKSLVDETTNIKNELVECHINLKNNLIEKNIDILDSDKMSDLIHKVKNTNYIIGYNNLPQWFKQELMFKDYLLTCKSMATARTELTSSTVDNKIYCIGGFTTDYSVLNYYYDPTIDTWSKLQSITTSRCSLTSSTVDNKIYCIGGTNGSYLAVNECYNPITNTWSTMKSMTTARYGLTSSAVDNKIYCIGGTNTSHLSINQCYIP